MDKIYECGRKFADLLNCKYHLVVSGNRKIMKLTLDFKETDLRHISGLHYIDDIVIENSPSKLFTAILKKEITDDVLKKSRKYNSKELYEGGSIEERVSEMRFLERYLDENNFIRIYRMQEFGSKVMADFFIESTLKDLNSTVYIFLRKRQESENYVVVSFFKKYQTYRGVNLYWMLKEKIKENDSIELYRNQNYRYF